MEKYEYQFPRISPCSGFCSILLYYGKLMRKPMFFPYDEVYHRRGILWGKSTHTMGKYEYQFPRFTPYNRFCCTFPYYGKFMEKPTHFSYDDVYHRIGSNGKIAPILWEKYEYQFLRLSSYNGFCCILPHSGKLMGKSMHFLYNEIG